MSMIEKVARAIEPNFFTKYDAEKASGRKAQNGEPWYDVCYGAEYSYQIGRAKAAIEAMRQPSDEMMIEMEVVAPELMCFNKKEESPSYLAWQAGIDAALKEE